MTTIENYKGFDIELDSDGIFKTSNRELESETLKGLKEMIDKSQKVRQEAWIKESNQLYKGFITSIVEERGYYSYQKSYRAWVSFKDNKGDNRRFKTFGGIFKITDKNNNLVKSISELNKQIDDLEEQREKLFKELEEVNINDLVKK